MGKIIYLDTNIFLHCQPFDQVDWLKVLNTDSVIIKIPPVTIRELNKSKELHPHAYIRKRANEIIKKLFDLIEYGSRAEIRKGVQVYFEDRDPIIDFAEHQLNPNVQDDHLIASIIMNREESPTDRIVLITSDMGLALLAKAKRLGIDTLRIPDNYRIPDKPDPKEIKIKQLEQKIRELNSRAPLLVLAFKDGLQHSTFNLARPVELDQSIIDRKLTELKKKFPLIELKEQDRDSRVHQNSLENTMIISALAMIGTISQDEINRYNSEVKKYISAYANFLKQSSDFENLKRRTIRLELVLANDGHAPAEDIDIYIRFPDGFRVLVEDELPNPPSPPKPPVKPMTQILKLASSLNYSSQMLQVPYLKSINHPSITLLSNVSPPNIKRTDNYEVHVHVQKIKHNLQVSLDPLFIVFDSYEGSSSFAIEYSILASNTPKEIKGNIHVIIKKDT